MDVISGATSAEERSRAARVAVLPVGSFEQHGAYLPLATDTLIAATIAREVATAYNLFLLPPVTISCSHEHAGFPGTVSISAATLHALITDVAACLARSGVQRLALVNGHGGNYVLSNVVQEANERDVRMTLFPSRDDWATARTAAGLETSAHEDMHAGELETSLLLHAHPQAVRAGIDAADHTADHRPHLLALGVRGYTDTGVIGRPSLATADKGKLLLDSLTQSFAAHLRLLTQPPG